MNKTFVDYDDFVDNLIVSIDRYLLRIEDEQFINDFVANILLDSFDGISLETYLELHEYCIFKLKYLRRSKWIY